MPLPHKKKVQEDLLPGVRLIGHFKLSVDENMCVVVDGCLSLYVSPAMDS